MKSYIREYTPLGGIPARPSKSYLFGLVEADLSLLSACERAADIASNDFKNSSMFHSGTYFGVDVDSAALERGLQSHKSDGYFQSPISIEKMNEYDEEPEQSHVAIEGDIRNENFPEASLDLVLSTHTLGHVPAEDRETVVKNFVGYLREGGHLLLQFGEAEWLTSELRTHLNERFTRIEEVPYRNRISRTYESAMGSNGRCEFPEINGRMDWWKYAGMNVASASLSAIESTQVFPGSSIYLRCLGRDYT